MRLPPSWVDALGGDLLLEPDYDELRSFLTAEESSHAVYPPPDDRLAAFERTDFEAVRAVILGQDPYHGPGQAHGLCFSVNRPCAPPPSLKNIYKELSADLQLPPPTHGDLGPWADRGVLLLNTVLTVRHKAAGSHRKRGWERFTDRVIDTLSSRPEPVAFLLWGRSAHSKAPRIASHHLTLCAPHPSPLSAYRGFFGCGHFGQVNRWLESRGQQPIDWSLPD